MDKGMQFNCNHGYDTRLTTIDECEDCENCQECDTYASMINETLDIQNATPHISYKWIPDFIYPHISTHEPPDINYNYFKPHRDDLQILPEKIGPGG